MPWSVSVIDRIVCWGQLRSRYANAAHHASHFSLKIPVDTQHNIHNYDVQIKAPDNTMISYQLLKFCTLSRALEADALNHDWTQRMHYHPLLLQNGFCFCGIIYSQYSQHCQQNTMQFCSLCTYCNFLSFHSTLYSTGLIISITLQCSIDCHPLPFSSVVLLLPSSPVRILLAANQWVLVYSNELVIGWAWCQRGSSTSFRQYAQVMKTHALHKHIHTFTGQRETVTMLLTLHTLPRRLH